MTILDWTRLIALPKWCPLSKANLSVHLIESPLYHAGDQLYVTLGGYNFASNTADGSPFIMMLLWASSHGAAQRVINNKVEDDSAQIDASPPEVLFPSKDSITYGQIVSSFENKGFERRLMETGTYRGSDGLFVARTISAHPFTYYFRSKKHEDEEKPFAIEYSLIGK